MAGVLERIGRQQKRSLIGHTPMAPLANLMVLELKTAKEILAEVFRVGISDVEEMIQNRYDEICYAKPGYEETEPWPREFMLKE